MDEKVRKVIRLYTLKEITALYPGCTRKQLNTQRDSFAIGAFTNASIIIEAVNDSIVYPIFGKTHTTTIAISNCAVIDELTNFFSKETFKVRPQNVEYRVKPGSLLIKSKREKPEPIA